MISAFFLAWSVWFTLLIFFMFYKANHSKEGVLFSAMFWVSVFYSFGFSIFTFYGFYILMELP